MFYVIYEVGDLMMDETDIILSLKEGTNLSRVMRIVLECLIAKMKQNNLWIPSLSWNWKSGNAFLKDFKEGNNWDLTTYIRNDAYVKE